MRNLGAEREGYAFGAMGMHDKVRKLAAKDFFKRMKLGRDDFDFKTATTQRRCRFQRDETPADDRDAARVEQLCNDAAAILERSQQKNVRQIGSRRLQLDGRRAGRQQNLSIGLASTVAELNRLVAGIQTVRADTALEFDIERS